MHRLHRTFVKMAIADISELASHIYEPRILEQLMKKRRGRRRRGPTSTTMTIATHTTNAFATTTMLVSDYDDDWL